MRPCFSRFVSGSSVPRIARRVLLAFLVAAAAAPAAAAVVTDNLNDVDATSSQSKYSVTYDNAQVTVNYNPADVGNQHGTLTVTINWGQGDFAARSIVFEQTEAPTDGFENDKGLRQQLVLNLGNMTGKPWSRFEVMTDDNSVPAKLGAGIGGEGAHLRKAHFHPNPGGLSIQQSDFNTSNSFNNKVLLVVSGKSHKNGQTLKLSNFFLHERNLKDDTNQAVKRKFTLLLKPTPLPEPATIVIFGGGLAAIGAWRIWRRRHAETPPVV